MVAARSLRAAGLLLGLALGVSAGCNLLFDIGRGAVAADGGADDPAEAAPPSLVDAVAPVDASGDAPPVECGLPRGGDKPCVTGAPCAERRIYDVPSDAGGAVFRRLAAFGDRFYVATTEGLHSLRPGEPTLTRLTATPVPVDALSVGAPDVVFTAWRVGGEATFTRYACQAGTCATVSATQFADAVGDVAASSATAAWVRAGGLTRFDAEDGGVRTLSGVPVGTSLAVRGARVVLGYGKESSGTGGVSVFDGAAITSLLATLGAPRRLATSCADVFVTLSPAGAQPSRLVATSLGGDGTLDAARRTLPGPGGAELGPLAVDATHVWFVASQSGRRALHAAAVGSFSGAAPGPASVEVDSTVDDGGQASALDVAVTDTHVAVLGARALLVLRKYE